MGFDQNDTERCVGILEGVFGIPTPQSHDSPAWTFQFHHRIGLSPAIWLLERKALPVDTRAAMATIRAWFSIQDPVTSHPHQGATHLIPQRGQEAVVAILGIGYDEV
jgi:hypothetical protein